MSEDTESMAEDCSIVPMPFGWTCECVKSGIVSVSGAEDVTHRGFVRNNADYQVRIIKCPGKYALVEDIDNSPLPGITFRKKISESSNLDDMRLAFATYSTAIFQE